MLSLGFEILLGKARRAHSRRKIVAKNDVQFQAGLSMAEFMSRYGTELLCQAALEKSR